MKYLKVAAGKAEDARRKLIEAGALDTSVEIVREAGHVLFPVSKEVKIREAGVVELEGKARKEKSKSLNEALAGKLTESELSLVPSAFDIVGDIAILDLPDGIVARKKVIADALLSTFRNIRVVCLKASKVDSEFRVPGIEWIAGERRNETVHMEHGCKIKLDVSKVYFSPRLSTERMRIVEKINDGENVLVLFAGAGPYAILAAKKRKCYVTAIELNPSGAAYMRENVKLNKLDNVKVIEGDVKKEAPKLNGEYDRIVMPLPKDAGNFLDVTLPALKKGGVVHFYDFAHTPEESAEKVLAITRELGYKARIIEAVECGSYSPCLSRMCVDFTVGDINPGKR